MRPFLAILMAWVFLGTNSLAFVARDALAQNSDLPRNIVDRPTAEFPPASQTSHWPFILAIFVFSGAVGGILAALQLADISFLIVSSDLSHWTRARVFNGVFALLISALGGVGGSMAAMFVMLLDGKIKIPITDVDTLTFIASGVISGFLGFKLLKKVADGFDDTVRAAKQAAGKVVEEKFEEEHKLNLLFQAIIEGIAAQRQNVSPTTVNESIKNLEAALEHYPDDRKAAIVLGELYSKKQGNFQKGIEVLTKAMEAMKSRGTGAAKDLADFHFNQSCYYTLMARDIQDQSEMERMLLLAFQNLEASLKIWPENATDARLDDDFDSIRALPAFGKLVSP